MRAIPAAADVPAQPPERADDAAHPRGAGRRRRAARETPNGDLIAGVVFALAALTDGLDGYIARRRDSVTTFGKLMDPLADKLLIVAALSRSSRSTGSRPGSRW